VKNPLRTVLFNFVLRPSLDHDPTSKPGLNLSPEGQWLIYSIDDYRSLDIMLLEDFR